MDQQRATDTGSVAPERTTAYPGTTHAAVPTAAPSSPVSAQGATVLSMLAGLWVALSPWVLGSQTVAAHNLIVGLSIAAFGLLALSGSRGFASLQSASLLAGVWVLISPWILGITVNVGGVMFWSNLITGAAIVLLSILGGGISSISAMRSR